MWSQYDGIHIDIIIYVKREVPKELAEEYAKDTGVIFMEVSVSYL